MSDIQYKILVIGNCLDWLSEHSYPFISNTLQCESLTDSSALVGVLTTFKPDVVLLDITCTHCSAFNLVEQIKKHDDSSNAAIVSVSATLSEIQQIKAIEKGVDLFLTRPVSIELLESTLVAKAKKSNTLISKTKQLQLSLKENRYQVTTLNKHCLVSETNTQGNIIHVNEKFCQVSGYSKSELLGKNHRMIKSEHHSKSFYQNLWTTIKSGKVWQGIVCNKTKQGELYWVEATIEPFINAEGEIYKYVSTRTDITALRQNKEELSRSQMRLAKGHVFAGVGVWDWNITTGALFWSDHIWKLFGYNKVNVETSYDNFINAIHPDDKALVVQAINNSVEHGDKYDIEHRVIWSDGSIHWVNERGNVSRDDKGVAQHMLGMVRDITDEKLSEANKKRNDKIQYVLQTILSSALEGLSLKEVLKKAISVIINSHVISSKPSGSIFLSDNTTQTLSLIAEQGLHPELLIKCNKIAFGCCHCGLAASTQKIQFTSCLNDDHVITYNGIQPHGHYCTPIMLGSTLLGVLNIYLEAGHKPSDEEKEFLNMLVDTLAVVIDRKYTENSLIVATKVSEKANKAKSEFLSSMSHELRTPMNAIMGFSQLMMMELDQPLTSLQKENMNEISKAGKHLLELINEVLDLSAIESGMVNLSIENVQLADVLLESIQMVLILAKKRNIQLHVFHQKQPITFDELKHLAINLMVDRSRLKQVFINLLTNAIKYNIERGEISINIDTNHDNQTRISITDTGDGLSTLDQQKLFTPFSRIHSDASVIEGTGMGLVITKNLVTLMEGDIGVNSAKGEGCTFWVKFNTTIDQKEEIKNIHIEPQHMSDNKQTPFSILYIEDNPVNIRLVEKILSASKNISLLTAHEGILGIELATAKQPDLILLDINLPHINGFDVLIQLKQSTLTEKIPVIGISANATPKDIEKAKEAGFDEYMTKPLDINKFLELITTHQLKLKASF